MLDYIGCIRELIDKIEETQQNNINKAAGLFKETIIKDRLIHVMGTGHSHMLAEELFVRAGGLAAVNALIDENLILSNGARKSGKIEKLEGLAKIIWEEHKISSEDLMIIISNSGRNAVPVEMAILAKEKGLTLITITSLNHSRNSQSRHKSGKKVYQLADLVIDNCVPIGDSLLEINGIKTGPGSTIAGALILNSILVKTLQKLAEESYPLPVYQSQNIDGISNEDLFNKYSDLVKYL